MRAAATPFEKTSPFPRSLLTLCAALCALFAPSAASAQDPAAEVSADDKPKNEVVAGFGLEMVYPFGAGGGDLLNTGSGANVFVRYDIPFEPFRLLVGVVGSYLYFPTNLAGVREEDVDLKRLQASIAGGYVVHLGPDHSIVFDVFAHLGMGFLTASSVDEGGQTDKGFAFDVGASIDYRVLPELSIGVNGGYGQVQAGYRDTDNVHWALTELHFAISF
jgi:hypothetical protein